MRDRCEGKRRHATEAEAIERLACMPPDRPEKVLVVYRCHDCGGWHLGHAPASAGKIRARHEQLARAARLATLGEIIEAKRGAA